MQRSNGLSMSGETKVKLYASCSVEREQLLLAARQREMTSAWAEAVAYAMSDVDFAFLVRPPAGDGK